LLDLGLKNEAAKVRRKRGTNRVEKMIWAPCA
jgi:hypothetical protein